MIRLYCVRRESDPPPPDGLTGVGGRPVASRRVGELAVWYSVHRDADEDAPDPELHDRVVRAALETATPLPCRSGSTVRDLAELERTIHEKREPMLRALERIEGCVEVAVRVRAPEEAPARPALTTVAEGRGYMEAVRSRHDRRRQRLAAAESLVRAEVEHPGVVAVAAAPSRGSDVDVALLVRRDATGAVRERIAGRVRTGGSIVGSTGPWPPYTFAGFPET